MARRTSARAWHCWPKTSHLVCHEIICAPHFTMVSLADCPPRHNEHGAGSWELDIASPFGLRPPPPSTSAVCKWNSVLIMMINCSQRKLKSTVISPTTQQRCSSLSPASDAQSHSHRNVVVGSALGRRRASGRRESVSQFQSPRDSRWCPRKRRTANWRRRQRHRNLTSNASNLFTWIGMFQVPRQVCHLQGNVAGVGSRRRARRGRRGTASARSRGAQERAL